MARLAKTALGVALAGLVLAAALLVWRLAQGPVSLGFLRPRLIAALGGGAGSAAVEIGALELVWGRHRPEVRARAVRVVGAGGVAAVAIDTVVLHPSLRALLRGELALGAADVRGARVRLVREADGRVRLDLGEPTGTVPAELPAPPPSVRALRLRDGEVELREQATGMVVRTAPVTLDVRRVGDGFAGSGRADLRLGQLVVPVGGFAAYRAERRRAKVVLDARGLVPAALAAALETLPAPPALTPGLARVRLPLGGRLRIVLGADLHPLAITARLAGGPGTLALGTHDLAVDRLAVEARIDPDLDQVGIESLALDLGPVPVRLRARLSGLGAGADFDVDATVARLPLDALARLWPGDLAPEVRRWVTANVSGGEIQNLRAHGLGTATPAGATLGRLRGGFAFRGLAVRYLDPVPPVTAAAGTATFSLTEGRIDVTDATLGRLEVGRASVRLAPGASPPITVEAAVRGRLADALAVLEQGPLRVATALGVAPARVGGTVAAHLDCRVPAGGVRDLRALGLTASARLRDVALPEIARGWSLARGDFTLALDRRALALTGAARVHDVPVELSLRQEPPDAVTRRLELRARLDRRERDALGIDPGRALEGPVAMTLRATLGARDPQAADFDVDLRDATLAFAGLVKPAGTPGRASGRASFAGGALTAIDPFRLDAERLALTGRAQRAPDGARWAGIDAQATVAPAAPGRPPGQATVVLRAAAPAHRFTLASNDAGALLAALGRDALRGGVLAFTGTVDLERDALPLDGHLSLSTFRVVNAPVLARIATLASFGGMARMLSSGGVPFQRADADLKHRAPVVTIADGVARGSDATIVVAGTVDHAAATVALEGSLLPSYFGTTDTARRIPVIGGIVSGAVSGTLPTVDFEVRGAWSAPQVKVKPMSSLTPTLLRDLLRRVDRRRTP